MTAPMKLTDLSPRIEPMTSDVSWLKFNCPVCGKPIAILIRIGEQRMSPQAWGASSHELETITVQPSIANPRHNGKVCPAHFTIDAGVINLR